MNSEKKTKWEIGVTIDKGTQAFALTEKHKSELEARLRPDELAELQANVQELSNRRSGQAENLVNQKYKTLNEEETISELHQTVISIRNLVKSCCPDPDILKAFGVGEKILKTVSSVSAAGNIVINAYKTYPERSKTAGIIEADITDIQTLIISLNETNAVQEMSKFNRKSKTMDKNTLQRSVEDEVTKLAALGAHVFRSKNPALAILFEALIPSSAKTEAETETLPQNNVQAK